MWCLSWRWASTSSRSRATHSTCATASITRSHSSRRTSYFTQLSYTSLLRPILDHSLTRASGPPQRDYVVPRGRGRGQGQATDGEPSHPGHATEGRFSPSSPATSNVSECKLCTAHRLTVVCRVCRVVCVVCRVACVVSQYADVLQINAISSGEAFAQAPPDESSAHVDTLGAPGSTVSSADSSPKSAPAPGTSSSRSTGLLYSSTGASALFPLHSYIYEVRPSRPTFLA